MLNEIRSWEAAGTSLFAVSPVTWPLCKFQGLVEILGSVCEAIFAQTKEFFAKALYLEERTWSIHGVTVSLRLSTNIFMGTSEHLMTSPELRQGKNVFLF